MPDTVITPEFARDHFDFTPHRKITITEISTTKIAPGVAFKTPEGLVAEDEYTRIAFDTQGGVYPIRESVYQESYETLPSQDEEYDGEDLVSALDPGTDEARQLIVHVHGDVHVTPRS